MTAVGQVKRAVMAAIAAAGGAAVESYSVEQLKCYQTAVAAVGAKETAIDESGAIEYLGEKTDEKTQQPVSVYGRRMRLTLLLEVYAPRELGAAGCETAAETVTQALMTALPGGVEAQNDPVGKSRLGQDGGHVPAGGKRKVCGVLRCGGGGGRDGIYRFCIERHGERM